MYLKASKHPAVVVLDVSFSEPIDTVGRSLSVKLNQVGPVPQLVHVARLSRCKGRCRRSICTLTASVNFLSSQLLSVGGSEGLSFLSAPHFLQ